MTGVDGCAQFSRKGPFKVLVMQETIRYTLCTELLTFATVASKP